MRANKMLFSKINAQYEILKMKAAYILAERAIIGDPTMTGWQAEPKTPQDQFIFDNNKEVEVHKLLTKMEHLEEQGRKALEEEDYSKLKVLKEVYDILKNKLNKL